MTGSQRLLGFFAGLGAGAAGGLFGVGGGLVLIPILTGFFKLSQHRAHDTSLAVIGATALVSVVVYAWHGNVAWWTAALVALASMCFLFGKRKMKKRLRQIEAYINNSEK
jgi:uncharacterized membrane protein YfcA